MSCNGHRAHYYKPGDCDECGHPRDEHPDDHWPNDLGNPRTSQAAADAIDAEESATEAARAGAGRIEAYHSFLAEGVPDGHAMARADLLRIEFERHAIAIEAEAAGSATLRKQHLDVGHVLAFEAGQAAAQAEAAGLREAGFGEGGGVGVNDDLPDGVLFALPRLTRHPSARYVVPTLTRWQRVRLRASRRIRDFGLWVGGLPNLPCECGGPHPHPDWN